MRDRRMLEAPVGQVMRSMAVPIGMAMISTFLFQVVDTYFVGQLGPAPLAALGFAATTYFLGVALFMGMAVGVSALVGQALGAEDTHTARRYTTVSLGFATLLAIAGALVGIATIEPVFRALGAPTNLIPLIDTYMTVVYGGMPLLIIGLVSDAAIRATGDTKRPAIVMGLAGVVNVVGDYLLIFGRGGFPELGLEGAAIATVASWVFVAVCMLAIVARERLLTLQAGALAKELRQIARLSTPAIATQMLLPLTAMLITALAAKSGPEAVAAFGVAQRIETLGLVGITAVTVAIVPFAAQNHGAKAHARVEQAVVFAGKTSTYWGVGLCIALVLAAGPLARAFSADPGVNDYTRLYLYVVAPSYAMFGLVMMTAAIFNGIQKPAASLRVLLVKTVVVTAPLAFVGSFFGAVGVFAALSAGNVIGAIYAATTMKRALRESGSALADARPLDDYAADLGAVAKRLRPGRERV